MDVCPTLDSAVEGLTRCRQWQLVPKQRQMVSRQSSGATKRTLAQRRLPPMRERTGADQFCVVAAIPGHSRKAAATRKAAIHPVPTRGSQTYKAAAGHGCCDEECTRWR